MKYMTIGLNKKVSLVLLPIDDFTDRIITGSQLHVYINGENKPSIRKTDGYHVFCDLPGDEAEVCLEGPVYRKQILRLPIEKGEPEVFQVRMLPKTSYPFPQGTTIVKGALPADSTIRIFFPEQKRGCKLLYDYDPLIQEKKLPIFRPYEMSLAGKMLCVCGRDHNLEFIRVSDQKENICILEHPLSKAYEKIGTIIYPVYETAVDEDGSFYLPISGLKGENTCVCVLIQENREESGGKTCKIMIQAGKENRITEDVWKEGE